MRYKIMIQSDGSWETAVIDPQNHHCADIVNVARSFGDVKSISDKSDDVPVKTNIEIRG